LPLTVQDACISATGRGILALGSGAVSVLDSEIRETLWNAISVRPTTFTGVPLPIYVVNGTAVVDPGGACVYVSGAPAFIGGSILANCLGRGVAGFQATIVLFDSFIINAKVGGVALQESGIWMVNNIVNGTASAPLTPGVLGDGVVAAKSTGTFTNNQIVSSERAGVSSFGSSLGLNGNTILCSAFDLDLEELDGTPGVIQDLGGNSCGCGQPAECVATSSALQPPSPMGGLE
jgi:hypothetical protein